MESLGYFLIALGVPLVLSAVVLVIFLAMPSQRLKPSQALVALSALSVLASFAIVLAVATFFGQEALDALVIATALASWLMAAPVLARAFSRA